MDLFNLFVQKSNASAPRSPGSCQGCLHPCTACRACASTPYRPSVTFRRNFPHMYVSEGDRHTEVVSLSKIFPLSLSGSINIFSPQWGVSGDSQAKPNEDLIFRGMGVRDEGAFDAAAADDAHSQASASSGRSRRSGGFAQTAQTPRAVSSTCVCMGGRDAGCHMLRFTNTNTLHRNQRARIPQRDTATLAQASPFQCVCAAWQLFRQRSKPGRGRPRRNGWPDGMDGGGPRRHQASSDHGIP
jgi:hypothetical protein